jgi:hypothetical protein
MLAALAQPAAQQEPAGEPVAVFREDGDIGHIYLMPHQRSMLEDGDKLYTRPAVPLTDEQIEALFKGVDSEDKGRFSIVRGFARAVEAAHGIAP